MAGRFPSLVFLDSRLTLTLLVSRHSSESNHHWRRCSAFEIQGVAFASPPDSTASSYTVAAVMRARPIVSPQPLFTDSSDISDLGRIRRQTAPATSPGLFPAGHNGPEIPSTGLHLDRHPPYKSIALSWGFLQGTNHLLN